MNLFKIAILVMIISLVAIPSSSIRLKASRFNTINVVDYGASGDGQVDDSQAFLKAWGDICKATQGTPTLLIPKGKTFLLKPLSFNGPCKSNIVNIQLQGNIVAPNSINSWTQRNIWIDFNDVKGLVLNGGGQIDGRGAIWWKACGYTILEDDPSCQRPTALHFNNCDSLQLSDITHMNSPRNHIGIDNCNGVHVSNLHITAPKESPNTDGIDISSSTNVYIENSMIGTGDDCIAINHGSSFINIIGLFCGPGHGISVGSLGANGAYQTVEEVYVQNCTLQNTQNGVRIKTWQGGSGYARKITFEHISLEASQNPIIIDQYYTELDSASNKLQNAVAISEVRYSNVYGTSADLKAINLDCSESIGCSNIEFDNISITSAYAYGKSTFSYCNNAHGKASSTVLPAVPCLLP